MKRSRTYIAIPPGESIKEQLEYRGMSQKEFAARMNMSEKHISRLINGEVRLTPETAIKLETVLGVPASFWNNLEAGYRETLIKVELENATDEDAKIAKGFPYHQMVEFGWVPNTKNAVERVGHLRRYFELVQLSLLDNQQITKIAYRRLKITDKSDLALMAWAQEAKIKARDVATAPINYKRIKAIIPDIRKMTVVSPKRFESKLKELLSECGVVLVFLPHLKGSFLQGASFIDGNKIVVVLTAGIQDSDVFWFSLFHELGHVLLGHVAHVEGMADEEEMEADKWASDTLIAPEDFEVFRVAGDFSERSVIRFAKEQGIAPGIVVGRMQHEGLINNSMLNNLKVKYESFV